MDTLYAGRISDSLQLHCAPWFLPNFHIADGLKLYIPQGVLYNSINLSVDTLENRVTPFAPVWRVANDRIPMRKPASLALKCNLPDSLVKKAFVAYVYGNGTLGYAGGKYDTLRREMVANVLSLGNFTVGTDLAAPEITPTISNGAVVKGNVIVFRLRDRLSGIKSYRVEIDGRWVLAQQDAKTRRIIIPLKDAKIQKGKRHTLVLVAEDNCGNESRLKRVFTW